MRWKTGRGERRLRKPKPLCGAALQCYSCTAQVSNRDCLNVQNCTLDQNSCFTSRVRTIGLLTFISKGCSSKCEDDTENYYVGKKNITCCSSDLCNVNGAHTLKPPTTLGLLTVLCSLLLWGSRDL
ncbi:prostate stem cell antigen isoform X2 [Rattus norvegicus]|uniref:prostate stem cell antigen isoform X2 n=1 Tax=Rattus norvegicus TaxID=10116 RepID=UPI0008102968|nr:prostate stem cell antigen isoform X1 [Rattus norvegicus]|eukprot:XP_017450598.1 PREDICTED: prostate stem cell antigen isoform X1 [Rattus norvegicus]